MDPGYLKPQKVTQRMRRDLPYVELAAQAPRTRAPPGSFFLVQPELRG